MKPVFWLSLLLIPIFFLAGCAPIKPTIQPTQAVRLPSPTNLPATDAVAPTATPTLTITEIPIPTVTLTPIPTLVPAKVTETLQPLLKDPLNCTVPCLWGFIPGKTHMDEVRSFFSQLGFTPFEGTDPNSGRDFYTIENRNRSSDYSITFLITNNLVDDIRFYPYIGIQKEGSPRAWIAYSPETLIKKFGQPSRVMFQIGMGGTRHNIIMLMYFDTINLIVYYEGYGIISDTISPRLCPLTAPFENVRLWMGSNPQYAPSDPTVPLEKATSLTIDQFSKLMLGDPRNACFTLKGDAFQ